MSIHLQVKEITNPNSQFDYEICKWKRDWGRYSIKPLLKTASPVISSQPADIFNQCIDHRFFIEKLSQSSSLGRKTIPKIIAQYLHCLPSQKFSKSHCTNSCINFLQTIECWVISSGGSDHCTPQYMPYENLSSIGCLT